MAQSLENSGRFRIDCLSGFDASGEGKQFPVACGYDNEMSFSFKMMADMSEAIYSCLRRQVAKREGAGMINACEGVKSEQDKPKPAPEQLGIPKRKKGFVIFEGKGGYGHFREALPIKEYLEKLGLQADMSIQPYDKAPLWARTILKFIEGFWNAISKVPFLADKMEKSLATAEQRGVKRILEMAGRPLARLIQRKYENVVVITTFPHSSYMLSKLGFKVIVLITDAWGGKLFIHSPQSKNASEIYYVVVHDIAKQDVVDYLVGEYGMSRETAEQRVVVAGPLPISTRITDRIDEIFDRKIRELNSFLPWAEEWANNNYDLDFAPPEAPLRMVAAVGGAGAQLPELLELLKSLRVPAEKGHMCLTLYAAAHRDVFEAFRKALDNGEGGIIETEVDGGLILEKNGIQVVFYEDRTEAVDRLTDEIIDHHVLITKPSELAHWGPIFALRAIGLWEKLNQSFVNNLDSDFIDDYKGKIEEVHGKDVLSVRVGKEQKQAFELMDVEGVSHFRFRDDITEEDLEQEKELLSIYTETRGGWIRNLPIIKRDRKKPTRKELFWGLRRNLGMKLHKPPRKQIFEDNLWCKTLALAKQLPAMMDCHRSQIKKHLVRYKGARVHLVAKLADELLPGEIDGKREEEK